MEEYKNIAHTFGPVWDKNSKIMVLGTFPSVKSRENNFYYGHPQNRFWKVIAAVTGSEVPETIEDKKKLLLFSNIAVWDVIGKCSITGSSDSSIRDVIPNNIKKILTDSNIDRLYANGAKAYELYMRYSYKETGKEIIKLPSTSPANAMYTLERLIKEWSVIAE